jgi:aminotransferase
MEKKDLEAIAEIIKKHDLFVLSDEIYSELTYKEKHVSIASLPGMRERTILINGFSKSHAMTGWRLGYACGPKEIIEQMLKIHQFAIMCAPTTSQYAAVDALKKGDEDVAMMREEYNGRRRYLMTRFKKMGLPCFEPFGAFYVFPCIKEFGMTSDEFATELLKSKKVAVVPGTAFGACGEGFLRISYAYSLEDLKLALGRVEEFIEELRK